MTNVKEFYTVPESNYNTYYNLKENTHDFHPTQHMFVPEQTRRYPTADSALPPQNGLRSDQVEPHCLVRHSEFLHCVYIQIPIQQYNGLKSDWILIPRGKCQGQVLSSQG